MVQKLHYHACIHMHVLSPVTIKISLYSKGGSLGNFINMLFKSWANYVRCIDLPNLTPAVTIITVVIDIT